MINIVYACNNIFFDCLYLSILSIIRRCKKQINFYVLTGNFLEYDKKFCSITKKNEKILNDLVKLHNPLNTFECIDCTQLAHDYLLNNKNFKNKHFSPYSALRLLIDLFPQFIDKIIYLDVDVMACGNIEQLFNINIAGKELAASKNWWLRNTFAKHFFNSGVLLININEIKKTKLFEKSRKIFNSKKMLWPDQTSINKSISKYILFPGDCYRFNRQTKKILNGDVIKHFCNRPWGWPFWNNIKQNDIKNVHKHLKIDCFDEDYKIWQDFKRKF